MGWLGGRRGGGGGEGTLGYQRQSAPSAEKNMGSSVAYKTRGTFLSQKMGHEDASGPTPRPTLPLNDQRLNDQRPDAGQMSRSSSKSSSNSSAST